MNLYFRRCSTLCSGQRLETSSIKSNNLLLLPKQLFLNRPYRKSFNHHRQICIFSNNLTSFFPNNVFDRCIILLKKSIFCFYGEIEPRIYLGTACYVPRLQVFQLLTEKITITITITITIKIPIPIRIPIPITITITIKKSKSNQSKYR